MCTNISNPNRHMFVCVMYEYMLCKYSVVCVWHVCVHVCVLCVTV